MTWHDMMWCDATWYDIICDMMCCCYCRCSCIAVTNGCYRHVYCHHSQDSCLCHCCRCCCRYRNCSSCLYTKPNSIPPLAFLLHLCICLYIYECKHSPTFLLHTFGKRRSAWGVYNLLLRFSLQHVSKYMHIHIRRPSGLHGVWE